MILFLTKRNVNINTRNDAYDKYLSKNFCVVQIVPDKMSLKHVISTFNIQLLALRTRASISIYHYIFMYQIILISPFNNSETHREAI